MAKTLLISADYVKKNSLLNFNVEDKLIIPAIAVEQDFNIEKLLGTKLYLAIQNQAANNTLTAANQLLLEEYIQTPLLYFVLARLILQNNLKVNQKGVGEMSSENEQPKSSDDIKYAVKDYRNIGEYYSQRLINFLKANSSDYQEYASPDSGWDKIMPNKSTRYFGGWYLPNLRSECDRYEGLPAPGKEHYYIYRGGIEI